MNGKDRLRTYFVFNEVFLFGCGIWPYQDIIFAKIFRYLWMTQQMVLVIAKIIKLYEIKNDVDLIIEAIASLFYNVAITVKFINGVLNEKKIKTILDKIQNDWNSLLDASEIEILSYYASVAKIFNLMYICTVYLALLLYLLLPLTPIILDLVIPLNESRPKEPLLIAEFYVDEEKHYYSLLVYAYIAVFYGIIPLLGTDTFYMNCVHHACGMIAILGKRITSALEKPASNKILDQAKYNDISRCIAQHQSIIEFCDDINDTYSTSFLIVLFLSITLMSVTGVATVIKLADISHFNDIIRFVMFTNAQIFHLFCYNYMGQNLLNSGEELREKIYNSKWYEAPVKTQGLIKFIILRNRQPMIIRARIFPLYLPNFTSVMKTSMSYFTVLQSTR